MFGIEPVVIAKQIFQTMLWLMNMLIQTAPKELWWLFGLIFVLLFIQSKQRA